jgi:hypothetical protein
VPQITVTHNFPKAFYTSFGIQEPYRTNDNTGGSANLGVAMSPSVGSAPNPSYGNGQAITGSRVTSEIPDFDAEIGYKSEVLGRIGPNVLQLALSGFWGQDTIIFLNPALKNQYRKDHVDRWAANFKAFIPIIPEKNLNKAGALSLSGAVFTGQNIPSWFGPREIAGDIPYDANPGIGVRYTAPVETGGWAQISYYITDKVYLNGLYGRFWNITSGLYNMQFPNQIDQWQAYLLTLFYDVNPAVRVGLEGSYYAAHFTGLGISDNGNMTNPTLNQLAGWTGTTLSKEGSVWSGRIAFWYFF